LIVYGNRLRLVAYVAEIQGFVFFNFEGVGSAGIGRGAFCGAGDSDGDTYERISGIIFNDA